MRSFIMAVLSMLAPAAAIAGADSSVPCSYFQALPDSALRNVQIQIERMAPAKSRVPGLCLAAGGTTPDPNLITMHAHRRSAGSASHSVSCGLTVLQMRALMDSLAAARAAEVEADSLGAISIVMLDTLGDEAHVYESVRDGRNGLELVDRAYSALSDNAGAAQALALIGCSLELDEHEEAEEVTDRAMITLSAPSFDRSRREVTCTLRLVNRSSAPLAAPLRVVIDPRPYSVRLSGADGFACDVFAPGSAYVIMPVEGSLAPGAAVEKKLLFDNPRQESFEIRRRVFSGLARR